MSGGGMKQRWTANGSLKSNTPNFTVARCLLRPLVLLTEGAAQWHLMWSLLGQLIVLFAQHGAKEFAGVTLFETGNMFRGAFTNDIAALGATLWSHVD